ncbi:MAG: hypothetical protein K0B14_17360 [Anaerolineaceae bacterium]|nr:hypothetical protein [Anaerolineaceae bacterium]
MLTDAGFNLWRVVVCCGMVPGMSQDAHNIKHGLVPQPHLWLKPQAGRFKPVQAGFPHNQIHPV